MTTSPGSNEPRLTPEEILDMVPEGKDEGQHLSFMCCFCGKSADKPMQIVVIWNWSDTDDPDDWSEQFWSAHHACFVEALHPLARLFPWNADGEEEPSQ